MKIIICKWTKKTFEIKGHKTELIATKDLNACFLFNPFTLTVVCIQVSLMDFKLPRFRFSVKYWWHGRLFKSIWQIGDFKRSYGFYYSATRPSIHPSIFLNFTYVIYIIIIYRTAYTSPRDSWLQCKQLSK